MFQTQPTTDKSKRMRKLLPLLSGILVVAVLAGALVFSINANKGAHAASAASSVSLGSKIASIANGQVGGHCSQYFGCPDPGEWCSDFARWVWGHAGANASGLTAAAGSFYIYGQNHHTLSNTPKVGDAVVFGYDGHGYAQHVAIVVSVNTRNHTIMDVGGNEGGGAGIVQKDGPYNWTVGGSPTGQRISGYIAPVGGGKPVPVCPATIQEGSTGSLVASLQSELNSLYQKKVFRNSPYNFKPLLAKDGDFGPLTRAAVMDFQTAKKIGVDGIVGPITWHNLGKC